MSPVKNSRVLFVEAPTGHPEPGKNTTYDASQTIDPETVPLNGGFLLKTLVVSVDPYILGLMHMGAYTKGQPYGVSVVLRTENPEVKVGDHIYGLMSLQEFTIVPDLSHLKIATPLILKNEEKLAWSAFVGMAGMPGQTAYVGWKEYANPQKGDVVFVTTASGPVGSMVVQLAKQAGLKVIATAGSDEKLKFVKEIGADVVFNYKTTSAAEVLAKEGPINIYWDNVGAEMLDTALLNAAKGARFIECGMISSFIETPRPMKNMFRIIISEIQMHGFIVSTLLPKYEKEFYAEVPKWIASGEVKCLEDVKDGLEHAEQALVDMLVGKNIGKSIIAVGEDI